jgi:gas vesicle protein
VKGFMVGILIGGVVGAAMGVLFAPMEGAATRQKVSDTAKNAADKVSGMAGTVKHKVSRRKQTIEQAI